MEKMIKTIEDFEYKPVMPGDIIKLPDGRFIKAVLDDERSRDMGCDACCMLDADNDCCGMLYPLNCMSDTTVPEGLYYEAADPLYLDLLQIKEGDV